jgi:anaerobic ribonucleoside-triphosphate reductase
MSGGANVWTFCRRCGWHSAGRFEVCPKCGNKKVNVVDNGLLLEEKGEFGKAKEGKG